MSPPARVRLGLAALALAATFAADAFAAPQTVLVSRDGPAGAAADADSVDPGYPGAGSAPGGADVTPDGRYVVFVTTAGNLGARAPNDASDVVVRDMDTGIDEIVSVPDGPHTDAGPFSVGESVQPSISDDGRFVAWSDTDPNLIPGSHLTAQARVWVRDRVLQTTRLVSQRTGLAGDDVSNALDSYSFEPDISGNGQYVTFTSALPDLDGDGQNPFYQQIYRRAINGTNVTLDASVNNVGTPADFASGWPSINGDGSRIAFSSGASNLGDPDATHRAKVVVRDLSQNTTTIASQAAGQFANQNAFLASISADGTRVAFESPATNLGTAATGEKVFVRDLSANQTSIASRNSSNVDANADAQHAAISPDGGFVTFDSAATNLVAPTDQDQVVDAFVRKLADGTTSKASVTTAGADGNGDSTFPAASTGAATVVFQSKATNLYAVTAAQNTFAREDVSTAPQNTSAPQVVGSVATTGLTVRCDVGAWTGHPADFAYEWLVAGAPVAGETGATYLIRPADDTKRLSCRVTAGNAAGASTPATSPERIVGNPDPPTNTAPPTMTGTPQVGSTLTCNPGGWTGPIDGFAYRWLHSPGVGSPFTAIDGAVATTYDVQATDAGSRVRCEETATGTGGATVAVSNVLTAAAGPPQIVDAPQVQNVPLLGHEVRCTDGTWTNEPLHISRRWQRDGADIAGATGTLYTPVDADRGRQLRCVVTAANDVGTTDAASTAVKPVAGVPANTALPVVTLDPTGPRPTDRRATCNPGTWTDDDGRYTYAWQRDGAALVDQSGATYAVTVDDLGRNLTCEVTSENVAGRSDAARSGSTLVPLPPADPNAGAARLYSAGGFNRYDPTNLLAASNGLRAVLDQQRKAQVQAAFDRFMAECRTLGVPDGAPTVDPRRVRSPAARKRAVCQLLLSTPADRIVVATDGVRIAPADGDCLLGPNDPCQPLPIDLSGYGLQPPVVGPDVVPDEVLWDVNADGHVDASCPGSAPVLRTLFARGYYNVRAVMVLPQSAELGAYPQVTQSLEFFPTDGQKSASKSLIVARDIHGGIALTSLIGKRLRVAAGALTSPGLSQLDVSAFIKALGKVRKAQPFACRTSLEPPAQPSRPCLTEGWLGKVHVEGNMCPISLRQIPDTEINSFPPDVQDLLQAQADDLGTSDQARAARARAAAEAAQAFGGPETLYAAKLTSFTDSILKPYAVGKRVTNVLQRFGGAALENAAFATDQIYIARGAVKINGVDTNPLGGSAVVFLPSDVGEAIDSVKRMTISASKAVSSLGGIPLSPGGGEKITAAIDDAKSAAAEQLKKLALDKLGSDLKNKLDLGPFKLVGDGEVKLGDGFATITASAELPALLTSPGSGPIRVGVTLQGDINGKIKLQGLSLHAGQAYLGAVKIKDLDLTYGGNGLDVRGQLLFPPVDAGISINRFRLGDHGQFQELDVDYLAGAGQGIPIGGPIPIFITKIGGGLSLDPDEIRARVGLSVGPSAGGGCPVVGAEGDFNVHFSPEPFTVGTNADIQVACLSLAKIDFLARSDGYVTLGGELGFDAGPLYFTAGLRGSMLLPDWMIEGSGSGGIRKVLSATIRAVVSNKGLAGCGAIETFLGDIAAGAGVRFAGGVPPLTLPALLANVHFFWGCDLGSYKTVVPRASTAQAGAPRTVQVAAGQRGIALSVAGQGAAPRVALRGPDGTTFDVSGDTDVVKNDHGLALRVEDEDKTVFLVAKPVPGTWTITPADGSPPVLDVQQAPVLAKPRIVAHVGGIGASRTLRYDVTPIDGQVVHFIEEANQGGRSLRTVRGGGKGTFRFTTSEARGTARTIVAQIEQDGMPRDRVVVARFRAPSPTAGSPGRVRIRRAGGGALVTWGTAPYARSYEVVARTSDGRRMLLTPKGRSRRVTVPGLGRRLGVTATVTAISPAGVRGRRATAILRPGRRTGTSPGPRR